jgi:hypothetical protein
VPSQVTDSSAVSPELPGLSLEAIERLALTLRVAVEYDSFSYKGVGPGLDYQVGSPQAHHCNYAITLCDGLSIGRLDITRHQPFWESELRVLEGFVADFCLNLHLMVPRDSHKAHPPAACSTL